MFNYLTDEDRWQGMFRAEARTGTKHVDILQFTHKYCRTGLYKGEPENLFYVHPLKFFISHIQDRLDKYFETFGLKVLYECNSPPILVYKIGHKQTKYSSRIIVKLKHNLSYV